MEYPKYKFNKDGVSVLLEDALAEKLLVGDWRNSPADFGKQDAVVEEEKPVLKQPSKKK